MVLFVSILAQPAKKMMPAAAKMRVRLELIILVFIVRCVLTGCDSQVENASTDGVNSIFRLSRKCNNHARIERRKTSQRSTGIGFLICFGLAFAGG